MRSLSEFWPELPAAAVEAATAASRSSATEGSACRRTSCCATMERWAGDCAATGESRATCKAWPTCKARPSNESWASIEARASVEAGMAIPPPRMTAMEPRTGADKNAADEPIRAVVAVGRACIRVVIVVAVCADRAGANRDWAADSDCHRANSYTDADAHLRVCIRRREERQSENSNCCEDL